MRLRVSDHLNNNGYLILLILTSLFIFTVGIGNGSLYHWDEGTFAQVAKEILERNQWVTLYWNGDEYFAKPPLIFWLIAITYKIFGISDFSARLVPSLFGVGNVIITYFIALELFKDRRSAFLSGSVLMLTPHFLYHGRLAMLDASAIFFILLCIWGLISSERNPKLGVLFGIGIGLGVMTKSALGLMPFIIITPYLVWKGKVAYLKNPYIYLGLVVGGLIATPWYYSQYAQYGLRFVEKYIGFEVLTRIKGYPDNYQLRITYYLQHIAGYYIPWLFILFLSFWHNIKGFLKKDDSGSLIVVWSTVTYLFFTVVRGKLPWYILPIYPAFALSIGGYVGGLLRNEANISRWQMRYMNTVFLVLSVLMFSAAAVVLIRPYPEYLKYSIGAIILALALLLTAIYYFLPRNLLFLGKFFLKRWTYLLLGSFYIGLVVLITTTGIPDVNPDIKGLSSAMKMNLDKDDQLYVLVMETRAYAFYSDHYAKWIGSDDLIKIWGKDENIGVVMRKVSWEKLKDKLEGSKLISESGNLYFILKNRDGKTN